jgi:hypothetical protein
MQSEPLQEEEGQNQSQTKGTFHVNSIHNENLSILDIEKGGIIKENPITDTYVQRLVYIGPKLENTNCSLTPLTFKTLYQDKTTKTINPNPMKPILWVPSSSY